MKSLSREFHDKEQYNLHGLDFWKKHNLEHSNKAFDNEEIKVRQLLQKYPSIRKNAIDIGSGSGWMTSELAQHFENVYAIEPSSKAIEICKDLYKNTDITWIEGYAEEVLKNNNELPTSNVFINTCSVFMHLDDDCVIPALRYINENFTNSILSFQELWSKDKNFNQPMTNCRSKDWWELHLSNWSLDFHGPSMAPHGKFYKYFYKGIHGYKK